ncbi:MAG: hypothetical protein IKC06_05215 [Clostridia bacterium]|nr:hypothetical protein [Clostridia bacterium]
MIIKITQTASNIKQLYDIRGEDFSYQGKTGSLCTFQPITLFNDEVCIKGSYKFNRWVNYIPFLHLLGGVSVTRTFRLNKNGVDYGSVFFTKFGFMQNFYGISLDNGETFQCYYRSAGSFNYVSIYQGDTQIALVETYLSVNDHKYTHKLYILEDYDRLADTFLFFVLYYASYTLTRRFHMSKGSVNTKSYSFSKYNFKYDENWRETHFPDENFFGKTHLFD